VLAGRATNPHALVAPGGPVHQQHLRRHTEHPLEHDLTDGSSPVSPPVARVWGLATAEWGPCHASRHIKLARPTTSPMKATPTMVDGTVSRVGWLIPRALSVARFVPRGLRRQCLRSRLDQEVSDSNSSRTLAAVGTRPDRTTFSSTTSPGVDITPYPMMAG